MRNGRDAASPQQRRLQSSVPPARSATLGPEAEDGRGGRLPLRTPGGSPKHASSALAVAVGKTGHSALLTRAGSSPEPRPLRLWPWGLVTFATLVGCLGCVHLKRTPEARFFVLSSVSQSSPAASSGVAPSGVVGLIPVRLPGHLERPQLVSRVSSGELEVHEFFRWAEPLALGIQRVVAENLSSLLHEHRVVRQPWPATTELTCRVGVEISGFDAHEDGHVALVGRYVVLPARGEIPLEARAFRFERRAAVEGRSTQTPEVTVGTQSELLGELSSQLAEAVRRLPAGASQRVPSE